jgi:ABC-type spermidine/putrescine transport system permease subunit I
LVSVSILVRTYAWIVILGNGGMVNRSLIGLGITGGPIRFLYNELGVVIGMTNVLLPFLVLPLFAAMLRIDERLLQAARSLGASDRDVFWRVLFPLTIPALGAGALLAFISAAGFFITPAILGDGRALIEGNFILPSILPPIITAVALYIAFARLGLLGTLLGLVIGHTILAVPYIVLVLTVAIRGFDVRIEQVAHTLGASWLTTFRRIVLPNLIPSIVAAGIFAFITSFDEVIVAVFLAGIYETVPKRMFNELVLQINPTITAIASLLIGLSLFSVVAVAALMRARGGILGSDAGRGVA